MGNDSGISAGFGFSKPSTENVEQKEEKVVETKPVEVEEQENVEEDYIDERSVTISLVKNVSLYRKANDKVMAKRNDFIGSSVESSRILSASKGEVEAYFPNLVGLSTNDPNFVLRVKQWLNNIRVPVNELGRSLNISFHYYNKKHYYKFKAEEEKIEEAYQRVNRNDLSALKRAMEEKITKLNALESTKYKYGYPVKIEDYLLYRHCLLYKDVAKDIALVNNNRLVRFYFKDDKKEAERARKYRNDVNKAKVNFVACLADDALFNAIYIQYCVSNNLPVVSSLAESKLDKEIKLDKFSVEEPVKFNKMFANKDAKLIANIELLIAHGELNRSEYNQNITTADGEFIGSNMTETVAWFKNPDNKSAVNAYFNKLKFI